MRRYIPPDMKGMVLICPLILSNKFLYSLLKLLQCLHITILDGVRNAVRHMLLNNLLAETSQSRVNRRELRQDIGTVPIILYHTFDVIQMPDGSRDAVQLPLFLLRVMIMTMSHMLLIMCMRDHVTVFIYVRVGLLTHRGLPFLSTLFFHYSTKIIILTPSFYEWKNDTLTILIIISYYPESVNV